MRKGIFKTLIYFSPVLHVLIYIFTLALVFLANIMPGFLLKLSSPYWFDKVSYLNRMRLGSFLMALSFFFVGTFNHRQENDINNPNDKINGHPGENGGLNFNVSMQLLGVAFCSAQGDLGEATLLALSGRADSLLNSRRENDNDQGGVNPQNHQNEKESRALSITAFASGTGLAGPLGFAFVVVFTDVMGFSLSQAMFLSLVFPVCYLVIFSKYLIVFTNDIDATNDAFIMNEEESNQVYDALLTTENGMISREGGENEDCLGNFPVESTRTEPEMMRETNLPRRNSSIASLEISNDPNSINTTTQNENAIVTKTAWERLKLSLSLWRFMIPLFIVYAAEYALQSGVWTAIGFPVDSEEARNNFYTNSNWAYQIGVFVSRSSGAFCIAPMWILWLMPILQCVNLVFFYFVAQNHFWYSNFLLIPCFYVGLLGGSVYVNGYMRINQDLPFEIREFALSTVSVADSLGTMIADISGLFIQSCLYKSNSINGAVVSCPI